MNVSDLEKKKEELLVRITKLESDLRAPLSADSSEQAYQLTNREIHTKLLEVERANLKSLNEKIASEK